MLASLGQALLYVALLAAFFNVFATFCAYRAGANVANAEREYSRSRWLESAHRAMLAQWGALTAAALTLIALFLRNDFSVNYVAGHSAIAQPIGYKISALWGGQAGSLLLWAWVLATYGLLVARYGKKRADASSRELFPTAVAVISATAIFFIGLVTFVADPFIVTTNPVPADGVGLNPVLQNYWMQIHPPTLYFGYVGCTVPFALCAAALLHRRTDSDWMGAVRRWTLWPWLILTIGIIMGGRWAYETLGWGGYWAWDPVENASLMPWLTGTAFLHSIMIQARRGMLKTWNMTLVTLTFLLSVFGTFLTRSGVISSVHSFAESNIGGYFLGFIALALVLSFGLLMWRRDDLKNDAQMETVLSREGAFLLNNWLLLGATIAILFGTIWPSISEAVLREQRTTEQIYYIRVVVPMALALLGLAGIGPLMAWRRTTLPALWRVLRWPFLAALAISPLLYMLAQWKTGAATAFILAAFVTVAILGEFWRGAMARTKSSGESFGVALLHLVGRNKPRYGGYFVHLGLVVFFIGAAGNAWKSESDTFELGRGGQIKVGEYSLRYDGLYRPTEMEGAKHEEIAAKMLIERNGQPLLGADGKPYAMFPSIDTYKNTMAEDPEARGAQEPLTARRPAIMSNVAHDLYVVLADYHPEKGTVEVKAFLNPLVMWIWVSTLFLVGGTVLSLWPQRRAALVESQARSETESVTSTRRTASPRPTRAATATPFESTQR
jgi:cytochrome c-type biogenesis protein CcmF